MAIKTNISIDQGTTFSTEINMTDENGDIIPLDGYTAYAKMKKWYTSSKCTEFTTSVDGNNGIITLSLTPEETICVGAGRYVYDVELVLEDANTYTTTVSRIVEGIVTVNPGVTNKL
jgi:hypothetical protein